MSRLAASTAKIKFTLSKQPFSNFDYVDDNFAKCLTLRRLFTLARARGFQSFAKEEVPSEDAVEAENQELKANIPAYKSSSIVRISFWKKPLLNEADLGNATPNDLIGFVILKRDVLSGKPPKWHVFESMVQGYPHDHNYIPTTLPVEVAVADRRFGMSGVLYCQQNSLNKVCAQVALRTLCTAYLGKPDLTYTEINDAASKAETVKYPCTGLSPQQIEAVLAHFKIPFYARYYPEEKTKGRSRLGYQKLLYSGVESGAGALIGFTMSGRKARKDGSGHIIPIFGHTFNEDTWAPVADGAYFKIGNDIRYIPSEAWMSSFLCHDDNFGSNFCLPKSFVEKKKATYIVSLRPRGFKYTGFEAEIIASKLFYSILPQVFVGKNVGKNRWVARLDEYVREKKLILRTIPNTTKEYAEHLTKLRDWEGKAESTNAVKYLVKSLPSHFWVVEVSIPDLFSTNLRKLGEIILSAETEPGDDLSQFVFGRLPGYYVFLEKIDGRKQPKFQFFKTALEGHTPLQFLRAPTT